MKLLVTFFVVLGLSACTGNLTTKEDLSVVSVNEGTNTAVVKVLLAKNGMPFVDTDPIVVKEGQRVVWAGPSKMTIEFKKDSPFKNASFSTRNAVVNKKVPKQEKWEEGEEYKEFKYDVIVDGVVLDPILIIRSSF